jgi:hypothetical protein
MGFRGEVVNRKQRRKVRLTLLEYRRRTKRTPEDIAGQLGWPLAFYLEAEAGKAGLSPGQKADVKAMLQKEIKAATVRDQLRGVSRTGRIPLIGGARLVEATSIERMPAPWIETHNLPRTTVETGWVDPETGVAHMNKPEGE